MVRINIDEAEDWYIDGGGELAFKYQGTPFTGIIEELDDNGILCLEQEYLGGVLEGWVRGYFPTGQLAEEYQSHNNKVVPGTFRSFDEAGNLLKHF